MQTDCLKKQRKVEYDLNVVYKFLFVAYTIPIQLYVVLRQSIYMLFKAMSTNRFCIVIKRIFMGGWRDEWNNGRVR